MDISQAAFDLIVREEDSDQAYYTRHYQHFDWPQGASGPTIGIGYDCGYVSPVECRADWGGIVDASTLTILLQAVGKKGAVAQGWVAAHRTWVTIPWDLALREFSEREIPKWVAHVRHALPNTTKLNPDCLGALVSLAYNRGASFGLPGPRFAEMRAIHEHMAMSAFDQIPGEFRSMKRLWPNMAGLRARREHEAKLFEQGLAAMQAELVS